MKIRFENGRWVAVPEVGDVIDVTVVDRNGGKPFQVTYDGRNIWDLIEEAHPDDSVAVKPELTVSVGPVKAVVDDPTPSTRKPTLMAEATLTNADPTPES